MIHIQDQVFRGHEIIIMQDTYDDGMPIDGSYTVDIRADNADGDIIAGYTEFKTVADARYNAMAFIDGIHWGKEHHKHDVGKANQRFYGGRLIHDIN